jgi:signal transduction histidine kinase
VGPGTAAGTWEGTLTRRDGPPFTAEIALYEYVGRQRVCVIRDLSALRAAQAEAAEAERRRAVEAAQTRLHQERDRYAREVNDSIVQGLVAAEMCYDLGEHERARELIGTTSRRARRWIGELISASGPLHPGVARRTPVDGDTGDPGRAGQVTMEDRP